MKCIKRSTLMVVVALSFSLCLVACAPKASDSSSVDAKTAPTMQTDGAAYVSDEQCLSCHGGTNEALAKTTSNLGTWNPHDPVHGGYNSCGNCHAQDKEISDNYCSHCHAYAPDANAA